MKKTLFLISLFLLILSGCSNNTLKQSDATSQIAPDENKEISVVNYQYEEDKKTIDLKIFFSTTNDNEGLIDVSKTEYVVRKVSADSHIATVVLEQLFLGPTEEEIENGLVPFWEQYDMKKHLKSVHVEKNDDFWGMIAYVNWKESLLDNGGIGTSAGGVLFGSPINDTLLALPNITKVINAVEGKPELLIQHMQGSCEYQDEGVCDTAPFDSGNEDVINLGYKLINSNYTYKYNEKTITVDEIRELITDNNEGLYWGTSYITANTDGSVIYFASSIMDEELGMEKVINKIYSYSLETDSLKLLLEINGSMESYHPVGLTSTGLLIISKTSLPAHDPCVMSEWTGNFSSIYFLDLNSKNPKLEDYEIPKYIVKKELNNRIKCMIKNGNY